MGLQDSRASMGLYRDRGNPGCQEHSTASKAGTSQSSMPAQRSQDPPRAGPPPHQRGEEARRSDQSVRSPQALFRCPCLDASPELEREALARFFAGLRPAPTLSTGDIHRRSPQTPQPCAHSRAPIRTFTGRGPAECAARDIVAGGGCSEIHGAPQTAPQDPPIHGVEYRRAFIFSSDIRRQITQPGASL